MFLFGFVAVSFLGLSPGFCPSGAISAIWPGTRQAWVGGHLSVNDHSVGPPTNDTSACKSQGRRVWLFANNPLGARASANLFSLVRSARANGLEPYAYLNYVFENLSAADTMEALEELLPWNVRAALLPPQRPI
jgi:hypothetical protein